MATKFKHLKFPVRAIRCSGGRLMRPWRDLPAGLLVKGVQVSTYAGGSIWNFHTSDDGGETWILNESEEEPILTR